jgi:hypothetical protein
MKVQAMGTNVTIVEPSEEVRRLIDTVLFYRRKVREMKKAPGRYGKSREVFRELPIDCYKYLVDSDGIFPPRIIFKAGFLRRMAKALRIAGYKVLLKNLRPHAQPEIFQPQWERMPVDVALRFGQRGSIERLCAVEYGQLQLPTGYGKDFLIRMICQLLPKAKIAITTPSLDVTQNTFNEIARHIPNVGLVTSKARRSGSRVMCFSSKSLHRCPHAVDATSLSC